MGGIDKRKGKQRGIEYEIKAVADIIVLKESLGKDTSYERGLLKSWSHCEGYESAKQVLAKLNKN